MVKRENLLSTIVAVLLLPEIFITRFAGDDTTARFMILIQAAVQFVFIVFALSYFVYAYKFNCSDDRSVYVCRAPRGLGLIMGAFCVVSLGATLRGFLQGYSYGFIIGDSYKFLVIPLMFYTIYFGLDARASVKGILKKVIILLILCAIIYTAYYIAVGKRLHVRPMAIFLCAWLPSIIYCAYRDRFINSSGLLIAVPVIIICWITIGWFSQSLTFFALSLLLLCLAIFFHERHRYGKLMSVFLIVLVALTTVSVFLFDDNSSSNTYSDATVSNDYLFRKFDYIAENGASIRTLELIGGDRIAQLIGVLEHWREFPEDAVIGQGMGGEIDVESVSGLQNRSWKTVNHYIEGGYPQVMLRTGIIGFMLYFVFIFTLLRKALRGARYSASLGLASAYLSYLALFSMFNESIIGGGMGSLFMISLFSALAAYADAQRRRLKKSRTGELPDSTFGGLYAKY